MNDPHGSKQSPECCPPIDRLRALFLGQLSPEEIENITFHVCSCPRCSALLLSLPESNGSVLESLEPAVLTNSHERPTIDERMLV